MTQPSNNRRLALAQAGSGLAFAVFSTIHLVNAMASAFGPGMYNGFQRAVRPFYQHPVVELLIIALPLVVHLACAVIQVKRRRRTPRPPNLRLRLHRYSGYFLAVVVFGHIAATRGMMLAFGVAPEFEGVSFAIGWIPGFFYPYYALLALCGLYHSVYGAVVSLRLLGVRIPAKMTRGPSFWLPLAILGLVLVAAVLSFGGWLYPIADPANNDYAQVYRESLGLID